MQPSSVDDMKFPLARCMWEEDELSEVMNYTTFNRPSSSESGFHTVYNINPEGQNIAKSLTVWHRVEHSPITHGAIKFCGSPARARHTWCGSVNDFVIKCDDRARPLPPLINYSIMWFLCEIINSLNMNAIGVVVVSKRRRTPPRFARALLMDLEEIWLCASRHPRLSSAFHVHPSLTAPYFTSIFSRIYTVCVCVLSLTPN